MPGNTVSNIDSKVVAEKDAQQLEQALTNLSETTNDMAEDKKAAQNSTNKEADVKKFVSRTCTIAKSSSDLCRLCGSVTTDTQVIFAKNLWTQQTLTASCAASDTVQISGVGRYHIA